MRVLLVHNRDSSGFPSGTNGVVDDEVAWLVDAGISVDRFEVSNDEVKDGGPREKALAAVNAPWSFPAAARLRAHLRNHPRPDVVHVHNVFPLLSPSVTAAVHRAGIPIVWTVHNYRLTCAAGTHYRDGHRCDECQRGIPRVAGIRLGCYDSSRAATAVVTPAIVGFRQQARRYLVAAPVSRFVADYLLELGMPPERVFVKYGGVADIDIPTIRPSASNRYVFVGRLGAEKGAFELVAAFRRLRAPEAELIIIGNGVIEDELRRQAAGDERVRFLGLLPREEAMAEMATARAVMLPSLWEEPFPRTAVEALSLGRPLIATGLGGLRETVGDDNGWLTGPSIEGLAAALAESWMLDDDALDDRGARSRQRYDVSFTPEITTRELIAVYERAIHALPYSSEDA